MKQFQALLRKKEFLFLERLTKAHPSAEVFLVGGIIRDILLKRDSKDYDFVVRNVSVNTLETFLRKHGKVNLVGKTFGVLKFVPRETALSKQTRGKPAEPTRGELAEPIDIALPRTEFAFDTGGYRDFDVQSDPGLPIEADLERRDFTINALAYDIRRKKLLDLFNGQRDLKKKILRTVGAPNDRFAEDYSRMLRALRFSCQLGFTIERTAWSALKKNMPRINKLSGERFTVPRETIAKELVKSFTADPVRAFELYDASAALAALMPELLKMKGCPQPKNFHSEGDVWTHTLLCLDNLSSKKFRNKFGAEQPSAELILGLLFHDLGKPFTIERKDRLRFNNHDSVAGKLTGEIACRLKLSSAGVDVGSIVWLVAKHMLATHSKKSPMKKTTLEKYFFNRRVPSNDLLKLMYADIMATVPPTGRPDFSDYKHIERQLEALKKVSARKQDLPDELLDGNEIMKQFNLRPGPKIGELKNALREEQLAGSITTKQHAYNFLKKYV